MHHPHTIQPVEQVNGTWVFWSLGNFVSGMGPGYGGKYSTKFTLDGLLATVRFTEDPEHPGQFLVEPGARREIPHVDAVKFVVLAFVDQLLDRIGHLGVGGLFQ